MHDEEGPRRLREGTDTPETLLRALNALRKGVDDAARLERVGQRMEAVMAATPRAAEVPAAASRGFMSNKLSALKLIVGGLGLLAPLFFFQFMDDASVPPSTPAGSPQPNAAQEKLEPTAAAVVDKPGVEPVKNAADAVGTGAAAATQPSALNASRSAHAAAIRARKQREPAAQPSALDSDARHAEQGEQVEQADKAGAQREPDLSPAKASTGSRASASDVSAAPPNPKETAQREPAATRDDPRMSEAELLLKARQSLKSDPAVALGLASEHQTRFANGRLAPEREVLAIEALRNLGRKREADERLHKFEARYPSSIHLKRLHQGN